MPIKKFGKQGFLNPVDSADSGWYKLSVKGTSKKNIYGKVNTRVMFADCSNTIDLAFDVWGVAEDDKRVDESIVTQLRQIKLMKAKAKRLRKAVEEYTTALLDAYDVAEAELKELKRERRKAG